MTKNLEIVKLKVNNKTNPICAVYPLRFSWKFANYRDGFCQSAYRIIVASSAELLESGEPDLWDSGKVESDDSVYINYDGKKIESRAECYWRVMVWDGENSQSDWSKTATFKIGLLEESDWTAKWIGYDKEVIEPFDPDAPYYVADDFDKGENKLYLPPPPYLKKQISVRKPVKKAYAYCTALGLYEIYINGQKAGDEFFSPGWADYGKRVYYDVQEINFDAGENSIGIILADGWYAGYVGLVSRHTWGDKPRVKMQLEIEYEDGTHETICTDETWQAAYGMIREADLFHGETRDARYKLGGWNGQSSGSLANAQWDKPDVTDEIDIMIQARTGPVNKVIEKIRPAYIRTFEDGSYLYDVGKNITGFAELENINEPSGTKISFDYAEILDEKGDIDKKVYRSARAKDFYIADGTEKEKFSASFTFRSFRYVKISGLSAKPDTEDLKGVFISSDFEETGKFECSSMLLNQVFEMLKQTIRCGYMEVPMDCCERDERLGWGQDGNHSLRFSSYLFDISDFIRKWQNDILDGQKTDGSFGPTAPFIDMGDIGQFRGDIMADCGLHAPWVLYKMYGDKLLLKESYEALRKYFGFMQQNSDRNMRNSIAGDWLQILDNGYTDYIHGWGDTARDLIGTAFYAYGAYIMNQIALALGLDDDAQRYMEQYEKTSQAFKNTFELRNNLFRDKTQAGYSLALYFGLLSENMREYVAGYLNEDVKKRNWSLTGGIVGSAYALDALSETGHHETAVKTMTNDEYPGYGYMVKMDATTCWERWDSIHHLVGVHPHNMNSYNHIGLTAAGTWLFKKLAGIEYESYGFKETRIEPYFEGDITHVKSSYESVYGTIGVEWEKSGNETKIKVQIPPNVKAAIVLPCGGYSSSGSVGFKENKDGKMIFSAGCGEHTINLKY